MKLLVSVYSCFLCKECDIYKVIVEEALSGKYLLSYVFPLVLFMYVTFCTIHYKRSLCYIFCLHANK